MKIKICGLSTKEAVDTAVQAGATHLGFILSQSRRQVSLPQLLEITQDVPQSIQKVGVFVNESASYIEEASRIAHLDMVQLHGREDMRLIHQLSLPVLKAIHRPDQAQDYSQVTFLLDGPKGGSGQTFDWNQDVSQIKAPYFVAGGLNPHNVLQAVIHFHPYGVDVSSGVETNGVKDPLKIKQFIEKARQSDDL